ncbi:sensor histidine kinase [Cyclobacterium plantarum]|uniref:sensor histidine kinase n=1 Tax=Cyclobacterium plantarum TaxID=2716263 RepID=UPI003F712BFD
MGLIGIGSWSLVNQRRGRSITTDQPAVTIHQLLQLPDPNSQFTFPEVLELPITEWQEVPAVNFGFNDGAGWACVRVKSNSNRPILMEMQTHFIDSMKVWLLDEEGIGIDTASGKGIRSFNDTNIPTNHRYFLTDLPMEKDHSYTVIIRGETIPGFPVKYQVKFWDGPGFLKRFEATNLGWGIFTGMIFLVLFISIACFTIHQKPIYFYFSGYIVCLSLYALLIDGWGIFLNASLYQNINPIQIGHILNLGICFFMLFSRRFLVIPHRSANWWLRISPWWFYLVITICIFLVNHGFTYSNSFFIRTGYGLGFVVVLSIVAIWVGYLVDAIQRNFLPARLLVASQFFLILFFFTNLILVNLNAILLPIPDMSLFRIALTAQLYFIALGWIYRQKVLGDSQEQLRNLNLTQQKATYEAEHRWQELQIKTLRIENEVYEQRERLARDLHDGIGSQLTHIISRLDILSIPASPQQTQLLRLRDFTRDTNQNLRETIWILNQKEVTCSEFALRLHSFLLNLWEDQEYPNLIWHCSSLKENTIISPVVAMHLMRLTQEAIVNSIKHAKADEILVELGIYPPQLMLTIKDDGSGFSEEHATNGFGLKYMRKRAAEMGACLDLKSGKTGTQIQVTIPISA